MKKQILFNLALLIFAITVEAQTATKLTVNDSRDENKQPLQYDKEVIAEFKRRDIIGVPGQGYFSGLLTIAPWATDNTGNKHHQLNFNDGGIFYRSGLPSSTSWDPWMKLILGDANGNVGIGTTIPSDPLHIEKSLNGELNILIKNTFTNGARTWLTSTIGKSSIATDKDFTIQTNGGDVWSDKFLVRNNGNVEFPCNISFPSIRGIIRHGGNDKGFGFYAQGADNTTSGSANITFYTSYINSVNSSNDAPYRKSFEISYDGTANVYYNNSFPNIRGVLAHKGDDAGFSFYSQGTNSSTAGSGGFTFFTTNTNAAGSYIDSPYRKSMVLTPAGNLVVYGKVEATEIKVSATPGADFVFEKDYVLTPLVEVDAYIKKNQHLPDIASAEEMQENGVNMAEFQIQLLQKIEELTLYTIEQNKKIEQNEKLIELEKQNEKIKTLEEEIKKIYSSLK